MMMLPGTGMGASGMGMGSGPAMPGSSTLSPQILAMLMSMQGPQGAGAPGMAPGMPQQPPPGGTPMAGYIGSGGNAMGMHPPAMPPVGQPPGMNGGVLPGATPMPGGMNPQLQQLLQQMKGQQSGVPAATQPSAMAGASPQALAAQMATNQPIAGAPPPTSSGIDWQALLQRLQGMGGGSMPQGSPGY